MIEIPRKGIDHALAKSVLVVDDDDVFRQRLGAALTKQGFSVRLATNHEEAVRLAAEDSPEFALVDLRMVGASGLETTRALQRLDATTKIVVLTGYGSIATAVDAMKSGALHYLTKPASIQQILVAFGEAPASDVHMDGNDSPAQPGVETSTVPSLARVEWEHIQRILQDVDGNVTHAARLLGVHRRSLQRKLGKYPVRR
jgi:two-component system, response regulator RegA